jgi:hypothetical protein
VELSKVDDDQLGALVREAFNRTVAKDRRTTKTARSQATRK